MKRLAARLLEMVFARTPISPAAIDWTSIRRILIVRQHDQLGDFLLATPVIRALRRRFPDAHIGVLARTYFAGVAACVPGVNEVLAIESPATWSFVRVIRFLRQLRGDWDLAIVLSTVSHSMTSDVLALLSQAPYILGGADRIFDGATRNFLYNLLVPRSPDALHQTDRNCEIIQYIGIPTDDRRECITIPPEIQTSTLGDLRSRGLSNATGRSVVGLHLGAGKLENRWPARCFAQLAVVLRHRWNVEIVLFWGPAEHTLFLEFKQHASIPTLDIGHAPLVQLAGYFSHCSAVVCNDTGVMHLAAATGTPVVAVFGPTDPDQWKPIGDHVRSVRGASNRVEDVPVESVVNELASIVPLFRSNSTPAGT
jgi:ADP-heptose:LPS heptosyltransferase